LHDEIEFWLALRADSTRIYHEKKKKRTVLITKTGISHADKTQETSQCEASFILDLANLRYFTNQHEYLC